MNTIKSALFGLALACLAAACGGDNECDALAKKICDGESEEFCKKTKDWLAKELVGPDGEKMSDKETGMACKMLLEDDSVVKLYKAQAKKELGGE